MVFGHVERAIASNLSITYPALLFIDKVLYCFHMPVMFFLSGWLFWDLECRSKKKYAYDLVKCVISLYVPYLFAIYGYWAIKYFIYSGNETVKLNDLLTLWFTPKWNLWFLCALCLIRVSVLTMRWITNKCEVIFLCFLAYYLVTIVMNFDGQWANYLTYGVFYAYGMCLRNKYIKRNNLLLLTLGLLTIATIFFVLEYYTFCTLFAGMGVSGLFYLSRDKLKKIYNVFGVFGKYSLEIYICHFMGVSVSVKVLQHIGITNVYAICIFSTLFCVLYPLIVVFMYIYIKPLKWVRYIFHPYELIRNRAPQAQMKMVNEK